MPSNNISAFTVTPNNTKAGATGVPYTLSVRVESLVPIYSKIVITLPNDFKILSVKPT